MKKVRLPSFNIDEDEAELFLSLKNAFSNLVLEENKGPTGAEQETPSIPSNPPMEFRDHEKLAEEINPDDLGARVRTAFQQWETARSNATPTTVPVEQLFADIETEVICVTEAVEYMINVLGSSKKTVESLGKVTDEYIKGWGLVEHIPDIRYRYCLMNDKLGAKWLDTLLEFSQLSVEKRTEWLNKFMQNWSYANGDRCSSPVTPSSSQDGSFSYNEEEFPDGIYANDNTPTSDAGFPVKRERAPSPPTQEEHSTKRGRSSSDMEDEENYAPKVERVQCEADLHKRLRWDFVKNMQLMGSIRFELCRKCGMKEECLTIAKQMNDREKIVESRLMAGDAGDDALNEAMNSLLHL